MLYEINNNMLVEDQPIDSHYFTITGIVKIYNSDENMYEKYYEISTWGRKDYIKYDEWLEELDYFTNYLHIEY